MGIFDKMFNKQSEDTAPRVKKEFEEKEQKKFGHNIKAILEFKRHQIPGKDPETGMSADYLTPEGQEASVADGAEINEEAVKGFSSSKLRAQETVDLMLENVDDDVKVINKNRESLQGTGAENLTTEQKESNKFNIRTRKELGNIANWLEVKPLADAWVKEQMQAGSKLDKLSLTVQWYLDNPEICKEKGVLTKHETAAKTAERLAVELGMTERFYDDSNVRLINVTHLLEVEPLLQEIVGFKNIEEIGGALKPGESIKFAVGIDANKRKEVKLLFRGKEYIVDEKQIKDLSQEYRDRINKK